MTGIFFDINIFLLSRFVTKKMVKREHENPKVYTTGNPKLRLRNQIKIVKIKISIKSPTNEFLVEFLFVKL